MLSLKYHKSVFHFATLPACSYTPPAYTGRSYEDVVHDRKTYMPSFYFHYYAKPLLIHRGWKQYLFDHNNKRYLDLISGISTVILGHSHPAVLNAIK